MLLALGFSKGTTLAFVMAAGFIADTASLPLIVSNPVNIVSADFGLGFREYASVMVPVDIAAIVATLVMLHLYFRKDIPQNYDMALLKSPAEAIKDPATFKTGWVVLPFRWWIFRPGTAWHSGERHCSCGRADIICRR